MRIKHSKEDYLESILVLGLEGGMVRSVDVAVYLHYSKASVCRAIAQLVEDGMVIMEEDKYLYLTSKGRQVATRVYEKHVFFKEMLLAAGVDEDAAAEDACKIEHAISNDVFDKVKVAYAVDVKEKAGRS